MKIKKIEDEKVNNAMRVAMEEESYASGYYVAYREIEGMNFAIYGNNHLAKRGDERGCLGNKSFWIDRVIDLLCEDEEVFWSVLDYKEAFLVDDVQKCGFFLSLSRTEVGGINVNKIYVKTFLNISPNKNVYIEQEDGVVVYNRNTKEVSEGADYIHKK